MNRYARQMLLPEVGGDGQERLGAARVVVIGAGGLAATVLPLLAGAGIGQIHIVDGDTVALSNLHRQHLFTEADLDQPKAQVAAARCRKINREIAVTRLSETLTPANAESQMAGADLVLDCADSYAASYTLSDICLERGIPLISASALGMAGYVGGFCGSAPSLRALFPDAPQNAASCATAGVLGPVVSMIGAIQAQMALAVLLGTSPSPLGQLWQIDAASYRSSSFRFDEAPEPEQRFAFAALRQLSAQDVIVELRSAEEAPKPLHPEARRLSAERLQDLSPDTRRLALCCATGLRSWRAAEQLQDIWPGEIVLVAASAS